MSCHGAGRWARTARYSGCSKKPWRGGFSPQAVGEAGHGVEPAPVDGEGTHAVEGRGLAIDGAGGRPGGAPGELVLADLIGGQRGGPRLAAEARGEMGDPAAGGALGPELPDLVVLEVGVAEIAQGRPLGAEGARVAVPSRGGYRACQSRAGSWKRSLLRRGRGRAAVGPHSLWWARQGSGMWGGDGQPRRPVGPDRPGPCGSADRPAVDGGRWGPRNGL